MKIISYILLVTILCSYSLLGQTKKDAFNNTKNAVVKIIASELPEIGFRSSSGSGTGYITSSDGYIITNHHVIDGAVVINAIVNNGDTKDTIPAYPLWSDSDMDMAVLKIDKTNLPYLEFAKQDEIKLGEEVLALGYPGGSDDIKVTWGIISGIPNDSTLNTTAALNGGNSGGPCINLDGKVVGTIYAKQIAISVEGTGFLRSVDYAAKVIENAKKATATYEEITGTKSQLAYKELCAAEAAFISIKYYQDDEKEEEFLNKALYHVGKSIEHDADYILAYFFKASFELYYAFYYCESNDKLKSAAYAKDFDISIRKARKLDVAEGKYDRYNASIDVQLEEFLDGYEVDCAEWNELVEKAKNSLDKRDDRMKDFDNYIKYGKRPEMLSDAIGSEISYKDSEKRTNYGIQFGVTYTNGIEYQEYNSQTGDYYWIKKDINKIVTGGFYYNSNKFGFGLKLLQCDIRDESKIGIGGHLRLFNYLLDFNVTSSYLLNPENPIVAFNYISDGYYSTTAGYKIGIGLHNLGDLSGDYSFKEKLSINAELKAIDFSFGGRPFFAMLFKTLIVPGNYMSTGIQFVIHTHSN